MPEASIIHPPQYFRLPRDAERDPIFSLSRGWYYAAEKQGLLTLVRLRRRGKIRGVVLVPYDAVLKIVQNAAASK